MADRARSVDGALAEPVARKYPQAAAAFCPAAVVTARLEMIVEALAAASGRSEIPRKSAQSRPQLQGVSESERSRRR